MQFAEGLSDSQAAGAVRSRIDWKVDAYQLVESHQIYQVSLIGPVAVDTSWQAKAQTGFDVSTFIIDWDKQIVQCPQGHLSRLWRNSHDTNGNPLVEVVFDRHTCGACSVAVRVVNLCKFLDEQPGVGRILSKQLIRSGTSIGANVEESQSAQSTADFIHKLEIALKEARET